SEAFRTAKLLEEEAQKAGTRALAAEEQLLRFRTDHVKFPVEQDSTLISQRLLKMGDELNEIQIKRLSLESKFRVLQDISPTETPLQVLEIAGYGQSDHVGDLIVLRSTKQAELVAARRTYGSNHPRLLALTDEVGKVEEELSRLAAEMKAAIRVDYQAALASEDSMGDWLKTKQQELVELKARSSEFRALQQKVEREWSVHQELQQRLSATAILSNSSMNILTIVEYPLEAFKKAKPKGLVYLATGIFVGLFFCTIYFLYHLFFTLSIRSQKQALARLGLSPLVDLSPPNERSRALASVLMRLDEKEEPHQIALVTPGLEETSVRTTAMDLGQRSAENDFDTLFVSISLSVDRSDDGTLPRPKKTSIPTFSQVWLHPDDFGTRKAISEIFETWRTQFRRIFIDASAFEVNPIRAMAQHADHHLLVIEKGNGSRRSLEERIADLRVGELTTPLLLFDEVKRNPVGKFREAPRTKRDSSPTANDEDGNAAGDQKVIVRLETA
ncbi:MAG: hypothetical protein AAGJ31_09140, partial [Verrucomicrobiota bacterium]